MNKSPLRFTHEKLEIKNQAWLDSEENERIKIKEAFLQVLETLVVAKIVKLDLYFGTSYIDFTWHVADNLYTKIINWPAPPYIAMYTPRAKFYGYKVILNESLKDNEFYFYDNKNNAIVTRQSIK